MQIIYTTNIGIFCIEKKDLCVKSTNVLQNIFKMTRFARAKGAAASNERVEEEATPWHQMAKQMRSATGYEGVADQNQHNRDVEDLDGDMVVSSDEDDALNNFSEQQHDKALPVKQHEEGSSSSDETGEDETENGKEPLCAITPY